MFNEEIFNFDITNIKNDLAIEGMAISDEDITLFKQFANNEIVNIYISYLSIVETYFTLCYIKT